VPSSLLVRAVFGLLVVATASAFLLIQRLRSSTPVVERVYYPTLFSPNGDGRQDAVQLRLRLRESDRVTVTIVDDDGDSVRTLADDRSMRRGVQRFRWDGRDDSDARAADGVYRLRASLRSKGRSLTAPRDLVLDTTPPHPRLHVFPATIAPGLGAAELERAQIRFAGPAGRGARVRVYRTDRGSPRLVRAFSVPPDSHKASWDGRIRGKPAPEGVYALSVSVQDRAGNVGSAPGPVPPTRASAEPRAGVSVRYLALSGPAQPVRAGGVAVFRVGPLAQRLRFRLDQPGAARPIRRGRAAGDTLVFRVPPRTPTGLYVLHVLGRGHGQAAPLAVRGMGGGDRSSLPLVVLPAITWQGTNPVDDDRDGFADTLETAASVGLHRPFAGGLPLGFASRSAPLMAFLDREDARYELTTDVALALGLGPRIGRRPGVLLAGSERWLTEDVDLRLREYVEAGGQVASFGTDSLRRRVTVTPRFLAEPSEREPADVFGERATSLEIPPAPMVAGRDRIAMFGGTDGFIGLFSRFEQSEHLVEGSRLVAAAGRDPERPSFVAYSLGRGLVIRVGSPDWASAIASRPEVARVTRRIWTLLSR
jgi:hypothetical protein